MSNQPFVPAHAGWRLPWWTLAAFLFVLAMALMLADLGAFRVLIVVAAAAATILAVVVYLQSRRPLPLPVGDLPRTSAFTLNAFAPWYDGLCRRLGIGKDFTRWQAGIAQIGLSERVLDASCGTGALAGHIAHICHPASVDGVDPAPDMIRIARENAPAEARRPRFTLGCVEKLPFPGAAFDVVILSLALDRLPSSAVPAALGEACRVLAPGGRLIVFELDHPDSLLKRILLLPLFLSGRVRPYLQGRLPTLLSGAGYMPVLLGRWRGVITAWRVRPLSSTHSSALGGQAPEGRTLSLGDRS